MTILTPAVTVSNLNYVAGSTNAGYAAAVVSPTTVGANTNGAATTIAPTLGLVRMRESHPQHLSRPRSFSLQDVVTAPNKRGK